MVILLFSPSVTSKTILRYRNEIFENWSMCRASPFGPFITTSAVTTLSRLLQRCNFMWCHKRRSSVVQIMAKGTFGTKTDWLQTGPWWRKICIARIKIQIPCIFSHEIILNRKSLFLQRKISGMFICSYYPKYLCQCKVTLIVWCNIMSLMHYRSFPASVGIIKKWEYHM